MFATWHHHLCINSQHIQGCQNKPATGAFHLLFRIVHRLLRMLVAQFWVWYWRNKMEIAAYFMDGTSYSKTYWQPWVIQYRLRTIKEKLLTGTETVLRLKGKIRMSIFGPVHSAQTEEKSKPLDGMQIVFRYCKSVTLFFSPHWSVIIYISWKGCKNNIWNNFPNRPIAIMDDIASRGIWQCLRCYI